VDIFVFGSNEAGIHGRGSALFAVKEHGAIHGVGEGLQGWSYAIPTKDKRLETLPLAQIQVYVDRFIEFARAHREMQFNMVEIGCGLAGYKPRQIATMLKNAPTNVNLPVAFKNALFLPFV
jgi:hypothetical protein